MNGQLYAPDSLYRRKACWHPIERKRSGIQSSKRTFQKIQIPCSCRNPPCSVLAILRSLAMPEKFCTHIRFFRAGIAQSIQRLATGWRIQGSNPGGSENFRARPDRPCGLSSLLYNGYRVSYPGVKRPRRGVNPPPPRVKSRG
jgi:hypothetical protein